MNSRHLVGLLLSAVACAAQANDPVADASARIEWTVCPENPEVECGTLEVPVDWLHPDGSQIELALARRQATDPSARIGALLFNLGGPGIPAVDELLFQDDTPFGPELESHFDIVAWDPRGVGRSQPVLCSLDVAEQALARWLGRLPSSQAELDEIAVMGEQLFSDCRERTGPVFDHLDMPSTIRDLEAVRAALGQEQISFYGGSDGTRIGLWYGEQFPEHVRAMVLDSVVDPSIDTERFWSSSARSVQDSFDEFIKWSERTPAHALAGRDARAVWRSVWARTAAGNIPEPNDPTRPLLPEELLWAVFDDPLNRPEWTELARFIAALDSGEPMKVDEQPSGANAAETAAGAAAAGEAAGVEASEEPEAVPPGLDPELVEFPLLILCSSESLPIQDHAEFERLLRAAAELAPDMHYSPLAPLEAGLTCLGGRAPAAGTNHRIRGDGLAAPLLLVNALHDPSTPYAWAQSVAEQLGSHAVLLSDEGWGHIRYRQRPSRGSACIDEAIEDYLINLSLPAAGARCPAIEPALAPEP